MRQRGWTWSPRSLVRVSDGKFHRYFFVWLVLLIAATGLKNSALGQEISKASRDATESMLQAIATDIRKHYYDPALHGLDWDARIVDTKKNIEKSPSYDVALAKIAEALDSLNDSHTFMLPPVRHFRYSYGWQYAMVGDRCFVTRVRPGSDAEAKGLHRGDQVVSISGYFPERASLWKAQYLLNLLLPHQELGVDIVDPGGVSRHLSLAAKVRPTPIVSPFEELANAIRGEESDSYYGRARSVAYGEDLLIVRVPQFEFEVDTVQGIMDRAREHKALILDLRGNPGGSEETLQNMVGGLFDHEVKIADRITRSNKKPLTAKPLHHVFGGKLVVLIDSSSSSAAELLARVVQLEKRGIIIGDHSAGAVMESRYHDYELLGVGVHYGAMITDADLIMTDGRSLEHVGVTPDEVMIPTAADLAAGRDPVLSHAAETLSVKLSPEAAGKLFPYEWAPE
jgi:carboxyl-terminal processing protease